MAGSVNKVILVGNVGKDPEIRRTQDGRPIANINIATSESWRDKNTGERKEKTEWHRIVAWGRTAELCAQYLAKGRTVYVEGRLQTRQWDDKEGNKRYTTEVRAQRVQMLGRADERGAMAPASSGSPMSHGEAVAEHDAPFEGDDIPF